MEHTDSVWNQVVRRASGLMKRYASLRDGPQNSWSLVGRAAQKFEQALPEAQSREHACALWSRAMVSVLNDLYRRERARAPIGPLAEDQPDPEASSLNLDAHAKLEDAIFALGELDERKALLVVLRYLNGLTWAELAERMDLSVGKVRREVDFSKAWLRRELRIRGVEL